MNIDRLTESKVSEAAAVWLRSGLSEYDYLPAFQALSLPEAIEVFRAAIFEPCEVWIATIDAQICAFAALDGDTLDRLYVDPKYHRQHIGTRMLKHCLALRPDGLRLFTHQQNQRARAFYESNGFEVHAFGISPPPESVPDVEYRYGNPNV